jgi:hypothetical protein
MKKEYQVLKLHESMPAGTQVDDVIEIAEFHVACGLVEGGFVVSLNTDAQD